MNKKGNVGTITPKIEMRTKEQAMEVIKEEIKEHKNIGLFLTVTGDTGWTGEPSTPEDWKAIGYVSALAWAYKIKAKDLK